MITAGNIAETTIKMPFKYRKWRIIRDVAVGGHGKQPGGQVHGL